MSQTVSQTKHKISLSTLKTPIERFILNSGKIKCVKACWIFPTWRSLMKMKSVLRESCRKILRIPDAIVTPTQQLHHHPPIPQHCLSPLAIQRLEVDEQIVFFDSIFQQKWIYANFVWSKRSRKQNISTRLHTIFIVLYTRKYDALLGSLYGDLSLNCQIVECTLWVQKFMNYYTSEINSTRYSFYILLRMFHITTNEQLPGNISTTARFDAKLGNLVTTFNKTLYRLISSVKSLSIDDIMVTFYRRSVVRQSIKANHTK